MTVLPRVGNKSVIVHQNSNHITAQHSSDYIPASIKDVLARMEHSSRRANPGNLERLALIASGGVRTNR